MPYSKKTDRDQQLAARLQLLIVESRFNPNLLQMRSMIDEVVLQQAYPLNHTLHHTLCSFIRIPPGVRQPWPSISPKTAASSPNRRVTHLWVKTGKHKYHSIIQISIALSTFTIRKIIQRSIISLQENRTPDNRSIWYSLLWQRILYLTQWNGWWKRSVIYNRLTMTTELFF